MTSTVEVRVARADERAAVVDVLAAAFANDPVVRWLCPDVRRIPLLFRMLVEHDHAVEGATDLALLDGQVVGASLWDPPGHRVGAWQQVRAWPVAVRALRLRVSRGIALQSAFDRHRPAGEMWYLAEVGAVRPGRGVGSALLEHRLALVDGPAYLESSNELNVPLYERFGFEQTGPFRLPLGGPWVYPMLRR